MLSELHNLNLKLCSKQYNKNFVLHLIVMPQLSCGWWHNYATKTRQAGRASEQSMYYLMSMAPSLSLVDVIFAQIACPLNWMTSFFVYFKTNISLYKNCNIHHWFCSYKKKKMPCLVKVAFYACINQHIFAIAFLTSIWKKEDRKHPNKIAA